MVESEFQPNWASPPGDTIRYILDRSGVRLDEFARRIERPTDSAHALLKGNLEITAELASKLELVLGTSSSFWLSREAQYREDLARLEQTATQKAWLSELPLKDMIRFGWIKAERTVSHQVRECLSFFNIADISSYGKYRLAVVDAAFRTSPSLKAESGAVAAWLRQGEIETGSLQCLPWNPDCFRQALGKIRVLTREKDPRRFVPELQRICAECGVAVGVIRAPQGCRASGAVRFVAPDRAMLVLSFRYLSDDHFWFTFFHEAGHLLLHQHTLFLESSEKVSTREEDEANEFAARVLIPAEFETAFSRLRPTSHDVIRFSRQLGVSPGIVVGQLQHRSRIRPNHLNSLKRRFKWVDE
jgi:HTH-type transcriptional regulator/antitoxin HigA